MEQLQGLAGERDLRVTCASGGTGAAAVAQFYRSPALPPVLCPRTSAARVRACDRVAANAAFVSSSLLLNSLPA